MARFPRILVPSVPHHIAQLGARSLGEAHHRYALEVNRRQRWTGHLWPERFADRSLYLAQDQRAREEAEALRHHGRIGRPLGSESFLDRLERATGRRLRPHKVGRKSKQK